MQMTQLLTKSAKTRKSDNKTDYLTAIQYLMPHLSGGTINLCAMAHLFGCIDACLTSSGRMHMSHSENARQWRTNLWNDSKDAYWFLLLEEIRAFERRCKRAKKRCAIRLNGTSDIKWEIQSTNVFEMFPDIIFYDYTKILKRCYKEQATNYTLVFSGSYASDVSTQMTKEAFANNIPTALVFRKIVPDSFKGIHVINGDAHDLLPVHLANAYSNGHTGPLIVGLKAKGKARKDKTGFVIDN